MIKFEIIFYTLSLENILLIKIIKIPLDIHQSDPLILILSFYFDQ